MNTKFILYTICLCILIMRSSAQAPNWLWGEAAGGALADQASAVCTDASGNAYAIGSFNSPSITFGTTTLSTTGSVYSMFLVKYNAAGTVQWAVSKSGIADTYGNGIAADASGNIFIIGRFVSPTLTFGTFTLTNAGFDDVFIVKYDTAGNVIWARSAGGTTSDHGNGITTDAIGNVIVCGEFVSPSIAFGTTVLTNVGHFDVFLAKYDSSGNVLWAKSAGNTDADQATGVRVDALGNTYVIGLFFSPSITFGTTVLTNAGTATSDIFLTKYDVLGNVLWAKSVGDTDLDIGTDVAADAFGNIYATGYFRSSAISFGPDSLTNNGIGTYDILLMKCDAAGNEIWARSAGSSGNDFVHGIALNNGGTVYITGNFEGTSNFGSSALSSAGLGDIFIANYDPSGNVSWAKSVGGTMGENARSISIDTSGNAYIVGSFGSASLSFGASTVVNSSTNSDFFIAKLAALPTATETIAKSPDFRIFPNPTEKIIHIQNATHNILKFELYNLFGELVLSSQPQRQRGADLSIDLSTLTSGLYFVKVYTEQGDFTLKAVKD